MVVGYILTELSLQNWH